MTYLTQILVGKPEALRSALCDSYAWHQALWQAFPGRNGEMRDFLSRVDDLGDRFRVYLLSDTEPSCQQWGEWSTREVASGFLDRSTYRFELRANPTVKRVVREESGSRKKNGRRTAIYDDVGLRKWLAGKATQCGFEVVAVDVGAPIPQPFRRRGGAGKHVRVDYRGVLRVQDRPCFRSAFKHGIGPAKAFGFGMLVLQPLA